MLGCGRRRLVMLSRFSPTPPKTSTRQPTASHSAMRYRVVLVPFPFDDLSGSKVRPAVCLTDAVSAHRHVVLAFISIAVPPKLEPTDVLLDPSSADFPHS